MNTTSKRHFEWNDDERKGPFSYPFLCDEEEEEKYVPITGIIKDYYKEDRTDKTAKNYFYGSSYDDGSYDMDALDDDLYCATTFDYYNNCYDENYTYCDTDGDTSGDNYDEDTSGDNYDEDISGDNYDEDTKNKTSDLEKIIDSQVYKKFSYV